MTAHKALVLMVLGVTFIAKFSIKILYIKAAIKVTLLVTWFSQTKKGPKLSAPFVYHFNLKL